MGYAIEDILCTDKNMAFDEALDYGINKIFSHYNVPFIRIDKMYADVSPLRYAFQIIKSDDQYRFYKESRRPTIFEWKSGELFQISLIDEEMVKQEIGYVHFQKRKMQNFVGKSNHFFIVPNGFVHIDRLDEDSILKFTQEKLLYKPFFSLKFKALIIKIERFLYGNVIDRR